MATELMMQVKCDRCERLETRAVSKEIEQLAATKGPQFSGKLQTGDGATQEVTIGDLCAPCLATVSKHLAAIGARIEKKSPDRTAEPKTKAKR